MYNVGIDLFLHCYQQLVENNQQVIIAIDVVTLRLQPGPPQNFLSIRACF